MRNIVHDVSLKQARKRWTRVVPLPAVLATLEDPTYVYLSHIGNSERKRVEFDKAVDACILTEFPIPVVFKNRSLPLIRPGNFISARSFSLILIEDSARLGLLSIWNELTKGFKGRIIIAYVEGTLNHKDDNRGGLDYYKRFAGQGLRGKKKMMVLLRNPQVSGAVRKINHSVSLDFVHGIFGSFIIDDVPSLELKAGQLPYQKNRLTLRLKGIENLRIEVKGNNHIYPIDLFTKKCSVRHVEWVYELEPQTHVSLVDDETKEDCLYKLEDDCMIYLENRTIYSESLGFNVGRIPILANYMKLPRAIELFLNLSCLEKPSYSFKNIEANELKSLILRFDISNCEKVVPLLNGSMFKHDDQFSLDKLELGVCKFSDTHQFAKTKISIMDFITDEFDFRILANLKELTLNHVDIDSLKLMPSIFGEKILESIESLTISCSDFDFFDSEILHTTVFKNLKSLKLCIFDNVESLSVGRQDVVFPIDVKAPLLKLLDIAVDYRHPTRDRIEAVGVRERSTIDLHVDEWPNLERIRSQDCKVQFIINKSLPNIYGPILSNFQSLEYGSKNMQFMRKIDRVHLDMHTVYDPIHNWFYLKE